MAKNIPDQDLAKGAGETEDHKVPGNLGLQGQLGHRDQDPMLKDADSDFPEPGQNPEHSGEPELKSASVVSFWRQSSRHPLPRNQTERAAG